jgi:hypothetical protein
MQNLSICDANYELNHTVTQIQSCNFVKNTFLAIKSLRVKLSLKPQKEHAQIHLLKLIKNKIPMISANAFLIQHKDIK